jgi:hypothetical protein
VKWSLHHEQDSSGYQTKPKEVGVSRSRPGQVVPAAWIQVGSRGPTVLAQHRQVPLQHTELGTQVVVLRMLQQRLLWYKSSHIPYHT